MHRLISFLVCSSARRFAAYAMVSRDDCGIQELGHAPALRESQPCGLGNRVGIHLCAAIGLVN